LAAALFNAEKASPQPAQNFGFFKEYSVPEPQVGQYTFILVSYTILLKIIDFSKKVYILYIWRLSNSKIQTE